MVEINRREFVQGSVGSLAAGILAGSLAQSSGVARSEDQQGFLVAPFRFDVTPPKGHSLCNTTH